MGTRLEGKVAVIIGAGCVGPGWGNGRATAFRFVEEGAHVLAVDNSEAALVETIERVKPLGGTMETHIGDATQSQSVAGMIQACIERFGRLDILVNNVGGSKKGGPVELSEEDWDSQVDYNLKSVFLSCKHALPELEKDGGGAIVNIASTSGTRWTGSAQVAYAATKAGVIQLSKVVAMEYASKKVRVNAIAPGYFETEMNREWLKTPAGEKLLQGIPAGRFGQPSDLDGAILFLASDASSFMNGNLMTIDGGHSAGL